MTLWLPLLDYARSYASLSREVAKLVGKSACVEIYGISTAQAAALQYHGQLKLRQATPRPVCPYLVVDADVQSSLGGTVHLPDWVLVKAVRSPADRNENMVLYKRANTKMSDAAKPRTP